MSISSNIFDDISNFIEEQEEVPLEDEESSTNSIRVLLVDADLNSLTRTQNLMTKISYQVTTCFNGEEAIGILKKSKHEIDLVVWDFHTPQINGTDALNIITKEIKLPIVIMSNDKKKKTVMKSIKCGACDFLLKPLSQEVIEVLWRHVNREEMVLNPGLVKPEKLITDEPDNDESDNKGYEEGPKQKKPRLTWTPELHRDFELAYKVQCKRSKAIPMEILKYMKEVLHVPQRLTRSNIASHLQKYRQNLSKRTRTDSDLEENLLEDGPSTGPTFWPSAGAHFGPNSGKRARPTTGSTSETSYGPTAGPSTRPSAGPSYGPTYGPNTRPTDGPNTRPTDGPSYGPSSGPIYGPSVRQSYFPGASNMFLNSNVNLYEGGRYVMNDRAVMNSPVQYASTTHQPMYNDPVITNSLLDQLQQQQYNLQLPTQQEPPRVSSVMENPVQLIYNATLPDDYVENLQVINSNLDQTPLNG